MKRFELNEVEEANFQKWLETHNKVCRCFNPTKEDLENREKLGLGSWYPFGVGMTGRPLTWSFVEDSMGRSVRIKCSCGATEDLTDYDSI